MPEAADNVTPLHPSKDARAMRRAVIEWLEQAYDTANGRYRAGFSDATIAKETGAAENLVKTLREDFYGEAGAPPEYEELQAAILSAERSLAGGLEACQRAIAKAQEQAACFKSDGEREIKRLRERLEQIAKRNGWVA